MPKPAVTTHEVVTSTSLGSLIEILNLMAESGWELVGAVQIYRDSVTKTTLFYATIRRTA